MRETTHSHRKCNSKRNFDRYVCTYIQTAICFCYFYNKDVAAKIFAAKKTYIPKVLIAMDKVYS